MSLRLEHLDARRWGVKGPRAVAWLQEQQIELPPAAYTWSLLDADPNSLILRLGVSEFFLEERGASPSSTRCQTLADELVEAVPGVYPVPREDASLQLTGTQAQWVLAEAGSFDFSTLSADTRQVVMTLLLGVAVIVIAQGDATVRCYRIWCDPTYATDLFAALSDVAAELS